MSISPTSIINIEKAEESKGGFNAFSFGPSSSPIVEQRRPSGIHLTVTAPHQSEEEIMRIPSGASGSTTRDFAASISVDPLDPGEV